MSLQSPGSAHWRFGRRPRRSRALPGRLRPRRAPLQPLPPQPPQVERFPCPSPQAESNSPIVVTSEAGKHSRLSTCKCFVVTPPGPSKVTCSPRGSDSASRLACGQRARHQPGSHAPCALLLECVEWRPAPRHWSSCFPMSRACSAMRFARMRTGSSRIGRSNIPKSTAVPRSIFRPRPPCPRFPPKPPT